MRWLLLVAAVVFTGAALAQEAPRTVALVVDGAQVRGTIRPLHGVNSGPLAAGGILDLSPQFREFVPPLVRLHDCHWPNPDVVDIHVVFPDFNADPARPESYDFSRTDEYVQAVLKVGSKVVFRLGESIEHTKDRRHVHPPRDPAKWAAVCVGVIKHYNEGWANGHRHGIRHWEIWNEPDNRPAMWTGTDEDYFRLYSAAAKAIKQRFPDLLVGGPGLGNTGTLRGDRLEPAAFLGKFLEHCRKDAAPLDFFSWHAYTNDPHTLVRRARAVRRLLDGAGFPKAESHLNEWNYLPGDDWSPLTRGTPLARQRWHEAIGGMPGAAFSAATLILLQDAPLDAANYFSADAQGMGLFNAFGVPHKSFHAFKAFRQLADTPVRLPIKGELPPGLAACAGANEGRNEANVLVSNFGGPATKVMLSVANPGWKGSSHYEVLMLDGRTDLAPVQRGEVEAAGSFRCNLDAPAVCLVRLRPARP